MPNPGTKYALGLAMIITYQELQAKVKRIGADGILLSNRFALEHSLELDPFGLKYLSMRGSDLFRKGSLHPTKFGTVRPELRDGLSLVWVLCRKRGWAAHALPPHLFRPAQYRRTPNGRSVARLGTKQNAPSSLPSSMLHVRLAFRDNKTAEPHPAFCVSRSW
jgi:hypothetical protein